MARDVCAFYFRTNTLPRVCLIFAVLVSSLRKLGSWRGATIKKTVGPRCKVGHLLLNLSGRAALGPRNRERYAWSQQSEWRTTVHVLALARDCCALSIVADHDQSLICVRDRLTFDCMRRRNSWRVPCGCVGRPGGSAAALGRRRESPCTRVLTRALDTKVATSPVC